MLPLTHGRQRQESGPELADIFRSLRGVDTAAPMRCRLSHLKVMRAVEVCRTEELGGHLKQLRHLRL